MKKKTLITVKGKPRNPNDKVKDLLAQASKDWDLLKREIAREALSRISPNPGSLQGVRWISDSFANKHFLYVGPYQVLEMIGPHWDDTLKQFNVAYRFIPLPNMQRSP